MADKSLRFVLFGEDKGAGGVFSALGIHAHSVSGAIAGSFSKMGSAVGGEFGSIIGEIGSKFDELADHASKGAKIMAAGGALTGIGAGLQMLASGEQQASDQLRAAVEASGHSMEDYESKFEGAVKAQEGFGHSAEDTKAALQKMTQATGDPQKALDNMGIVANLAAAKHISLADAADKVDKILAGKGSRTLAEYGIAMQKAVDPVKELSKAEHAHTAATNQLASAQDKYKLLADQIHAKHKISATDHDRLVIAAQKVKAAQDLLRQSNQALKKAHEDAAHGGKTQQEALDQLSKKIKGQADASVDNFAAKVGILRTKLGDWAAQMGGVVGPALTTLGPVIMGVGAVMEILTARRAAAAAAAAAQAAATEAETVATGEATVAQTGLNLAFLASPVTWIVLGVVALVAAVVLAYNKVDWFRNFVNAAFTGVKIAFGWILTAAQAVFGWIGEHWGTIVTFIAGPIGLAVRFVHDHFDAIKKAAGILIGALGTVFSTVVNVITWPFRTAFNAISGLWNSSLGSVSFTIPSWVPVVGGDTFSFPHMPQLAQGGIVKARPGGMVALLGEGQHDEAVIPLDGRHGSGLGGGPQIVLNVPMGFIGNERQLQDALAALLERFVGNGGTIRGVTT